MGRKKRKGAQLKPFCYYCDREFDNEKVLIQHQKAKHFKCCECNRKLDTATGLVVHMLQVHKETISRVPNANSGRDNPELIIHGMAGVPVEMLAEKQAKLDAERGAVKQQKTAHTVFGMSVMSGFFNQMHAAAAAMPGFIPPNTNSALMPGGIPNPLIFNQLMSQFTQASLAARPPSTAATATVFPGMANSIATSNTQTGGASIPTVTSQFPTTTTATSADSSTQPSTSNFGWVPPVSTASSLTARLDVNLSSTLGLSKTAKLVYDVSNDQISPEELLAEHYGYKPLNAAAA